MHNNQFQLSSCKRTMEKGRKKRVEDTLCIFCTQILTQSKMSKNNLNLKEKLLGEKIKLKI